MYLVIYAFMYLYFYSFTYLFINLYTYIHIIGTIIIGDMEHVWDIAIKTLLWGDDDNGIDSSFYVEIQWIIEFNGTILNE